MQNPFKLIKNLENRKEQNSLRILSSHVALTDFTSNDYLGFASSEEIYNATAEILEEYDLKRNGSTGSRLLSGNHKIYQATEDFVADFHNAETALIFNSGYDANIGFFSSVPQKGDVILYDELVHASIRDGIRMSNARAYKFSHNDIEDLKRRLGRLRTEVGSKETGEIYIVTESVFSMDGDIPDLKSISELAADFNCFLIVDEAHATGVFGNNGEGLVQQLELENKVFARIVTFGKALGGHGAAVLGNFPLREYLTNFARSFIYTTALPPHSVAGILSAYRFLQKTPGSNPGILKLRKNISLFKSEILNYNLNNYFIISDSAIHCCVISGNEEVKKAAKTLQEKGFNVKAILSPTVPKGSERLRVCLHSFNTEDEIQNMVKHLATFLR